MQQTVFDDAGAKAKYKAMLGHLASLNLPFKEKTVLEVGSGVGWHTYFFEQNGCKVLCTDGRPENVAEHRDRFPHRRVELVDMDQLHSHHNFGKFDIVHCYSCLYHLKDPAMTIGDLAEICNDFLIIETDVFREDEDKISFRDTDATIASQSIHGVRNVVGRPWLWRQLAKHFPYVYCPITQPEHADYPVRFPAPANGLAKKIIMIGSRIDLSNNPMLVNQMPIHYKTRNGDPLILKGEVYQVPISSIDLIGRWGDQCNFYPAKVKDISESMVKGGWQGGPIRLKYQTGKGRFKPADGVHRILSVSQIGGEHVPAMIVAFDNEVDPQYVAEKPEANGKKDVIVLGLNKLGLALGSVIARTNYFRVTGIDLEQKKVEQANSCERGFLSINDIHEVQHAACVLITDGNVLQQLKSIKELTHQPESIAVVSTLSVEEIQSAYAIYPDLCYSPVTYEDPMLPRLVVIGGTETRARDIVAAVYMAMYERLTLDPYNTLILYVTDPTTAFAIKKMLDSWIAYGHKFMKELQNIGQNADLKTLKDALAVVGIGDWNDSI